MKIAIIGGGAAGMMAAAAAAELGTGAEIVLIEKNKTLGQKVLISGGGRCNITTAFSDLRLISERYPRGGKFLLSSLTAFPPAAVYTWFEEHGVPLNTEEDLRVFPKSNDGKDILRAFETIFSKHNVEVLNNHEVTALQKIAPHFKIHFKDHPLIEVDKVILTTGGQAYQHTGSSGEGYAFAEQLGHTITPLAPSLNSFILSESWPKTLAGVSLPTVRLSVKTNKKYQFTGPILFTHRGITGPAVFALSSYLAFDEYSPQTPLTLHIDLLPNISHTDLGRELGNELQINPRKLFRNTLSNFIPKSLALELCTLIPFNSEKTNSELSKKEFAKSLEILKSLPLTLIGRAAGDEFVTAGGVELSEVDPKTMQSKLCTGLYFAGEILNIDGFTGGYNLQAAWSTGKRAGENCAN